MGAEREPRRRKLDGALLRWYEPRRRAYPWRRTRDPYRIWVSEVMLQQTQAARVVPAYRAFVRRFPTVRALARAPRSDVVAAWDGLGYNRRAVAMSDAARSIVDAHAGRIPDDPEELRRLRGVGPYTAAAVASIAFGRSVPALDTNVRRTVARAQLGREPADLPPAVIAEAAERWVPGDDPGAWNQALMDLGREICRPVPRCAGCPIAAGCRFLSLGATPRSTKRRRPPFEGSMRQLRGAVVATLRRRRRATLAQLVRVSGSPPDRVAAAIAALRADGLVWAGRPALEGRARGVIRLAR